MRTITTGFAAALLLYGTLSLAGVASDDIRVADAHVRAVPPGQPNSAAFMTLHNSSDQDHAIVAGITPTSRVVQLHTHEMESGMMRMRRIARIGLPASQGVELKPGGLHVMLIGLQEQLKPGATVELTLIFEDGSHRMIAAPVRKLQMKMSGQGMHQHKQ